MDIYNNFLSLDIRVGTIIECSVNEKAKKPAYKLSIDFGDLGIKKSSAQITDKYTCEELIGLQIVAVTNFPPKQVAGVLSEVLVLGVVEKDGVTLLTPNKKVKNGEKIA
jgi:tRNA-binding protein